MGRTRLAFVSPNLAQVEVSDVLYPSGAVRPEVYLWSSITKVCRVRNIYLTRPKCLQSLERWFDVRTARRWGYTGADEYRDMRPGSKLVLSHKGKPLSWHSNVASWQADRWPTALVMRCNRRLPGSTGSPVSKTVHPTVTGIRSQLRCLLQQAMSRHCKRSSAMHALTIASLTSR